MDAATLYVDLASPYGYLAAERAERVLGRPVVFAPILLGALFALRGHGSWAHTPSRDDPAVKLALREATDAAWKAGVAGVPTLRLGGELHYGDDRLDAAAESR